MGYSGLLLTHPTRRTVEHDDKIYHGRLHTWDYRVQQVPTLRIGDTWAASCAAQNKKLVDSGRDGLWELCVPDAERRADFYYHERPDIGFPEQG